VQWFDGLLPMRRRGEDIACFRMMVRDEYESSEGVLCRIVRLWNREISTVGLGLGRLVRTRAMGTGVEDGDGGWWMVDGGWWMVDGDFGDRLRIAGNTVARSSNTCI